MRPANDLLARTLRTPELVAQLSLDQWDRLVRQARHAGLLARLHARFDELGLTDAIPQPVRWHFEAAATLAHKQEIAVRWEVEQIRAALARLDGPLVVMKGAAYVVAGLPAARGRLFNDIDILVPRRLLSQTEAALMLARSTARAQGCHPSRFRCPDDMLTLQPALLAAQIGKIPSGCCGIRWPGWVAIFLRTIANLILPWICLGKSRCLSARGAL